MGQMKDFLITVHNGGEEAVAAVQLVSEDWRQQLEQAADEIERLRLAPDEREAINAMACYFDTKGNIQMQAWGSLLRVILLRNDRLDSVERTGGISRRDSCGRMTPRKDGGRWMDSLGAVTAATSTSSIRGAN